MASPVTNPRRWNCIFSKKITAILERMKEKQVKLWTVNCEICVTSDGYKRIMHWGLCITVISKIKVKPFASLSFYVTHLSLISFPLGVLFGQIYLFIFTSTSQCCAALRCVFRSQLRLYCFWLCHCVSSDISSFHKTKQK